MLTACKKYLDEKPDQRLTTIETLNDMQAMLDNYATLNHTDPSIGEASADNFFLTDEVFNARTEDERNLYIWAPANVLLPGTNTWGAAYQQVNIANNVIKAAEEKQSQIPDPQKLAAIRAQALFFRGKSFLNIVSIWALPFDPATADLLPGIPLRLSPDFNERSQRASLYESYNQIIQDLTAAAAGLPAKDIIQTRPSKAGAFGMLSRVYLQMRDYLKAEKYADSSLQINSTLLDYNSLNPSANFPFLPLHAEISYEGRLNGHAITSQARAMISLDLYRAYAVNDLRRTLFFRASGANYIFKGSYEGNATHFDGIATDEMLLTRSECRIRNGQVQQGLDDLNTLLGRRYKSGSFVKYQNLTQEQALQLVKTERRKELLFRGIRWNDIRRFNQEGDQIVLKRTVNGKEYTLLPNSLLYAIAIPEDVIAITGMAQNRR